ncbi:hypothetical protein AVEN_29970-1 [Araneus ventricosus]|uniref:Uncharacterized protein n=1 Tax=Araneus ventricosus TaxID=182803 RepID=A0A4Y2NYC7_ARAVE|nr:hypothetical protein AVEN_88421-1 [Araneus ventricosus]GBN42311.1 hypothetical protein AVEN_177395-1 [Araneus ventricosus]GBN43007.1 hypothetical protein AVEN_233717-1 [Araneus ventricosus]GBN43031.1 hypothetical protein AVEN_29970-1 [Araneus ventricosus]
MQLGIFITLNQPTSTSKICLKTNLPDEEFESFVREGCFTVRRSDKFWSMNVEQVLMRSRKVSGGLTQRRNMSYSVVARWTFTMPGRLQVTEEVEAFSGMTGESSEWHISLSKLWQTRDTRDLKKFLIWLKLHSPFSKYEELISPSSGIVADGRVNWDSADELDKNAVKGIVRKRFPDVT